MKKLVKTAVAAALILAPASAHAMPEPVPSKWTSLMLRAWAIVADHRPCSNNIYRVCDGHL
jgi:hypothetical protein